MEENSLDRKIGCKFRLACLFTADVSSHAVIVSEDAAT